jgi:glycosyltransferase involved in cell wall biosynthesis
LLDAVAQLPWLVKHGVPASRGSILRQMAWQRFVLPRQARRLGVDVMFNTDAGSVYPSRPCMTLSQDMLSFEPGEIQRYPWPARARIRLELLRCLQLRRLAKSTVPLFLTRHARDVIAKLIKLTDPQVIPHGIDERFLAAAAGRRAFPAVGPIRCLYVSNAAPYKHQWHVVDALAQLRARTGLDLKLRLIGGGEGPAMERLKLAVATHDPDGHFAELLAFVPNSQIVEELSTADIFIFASSCENLPVTLLEAMGSGLPIASSDRGPMPEVLGNEGFYFDPEDPVSIAATVERLLIDPVARERSATDARQKAAAFTWARCANESWRLLASIARQGKL